MYQSIEPYQISTNIYDMFAQIAMLLMEGINSIESKSQFCPSKINQLIN